MLRINQILNRKIRILTGTLILIGTLWTAHALLAQTPLPHVPAVQEPQPQIPAPAIQSPQVQTPQPQLPQTQPLPQIPLPQIQTPVSQADTASALTYTIVRTPPAELLQIVRGLCGHRFVLESHYHGNFTTNYNNVSRQAMLRTDPQSNRAFLSGDRQLCEQVFQLLSAIDQPLPPGKGRQIIPYQHTPLEVLKKAFDAHRNTRSPHGTVVRLIDPAPHPNPIQQVTHQFEGGFEMGVDPGMIMPGGMGGMGGGPFFGGTANMIDVPEDFKYMFIPELDVIIVEAEGARLTRFIEMIRKLEELSKLNRPKIEIVYLKHINGASLAAPQTGLIAQLYQYLLRTIPGEATITPMNAPNAVMLAGWGEAMEVVKELIEALDQPTVTEHSRLHIFQLKHISALQAFNIVRGAFPPPVGPVGLAARLQLFHEPRSNVLIVQGAPNEIEEVKRILHQIDVDNTENRLQMKSIILKNSLALDVAQTLASAIVGTGTEGRIPAFDLLVNGPEGQRLIKSGIMSDISISTDVRNNQIIIGAPEICMAFIEELILLLDIASQEAMIKIFPVVNGDAQSIVTVLQSLIPMDGQPGPRLPGTAEGDSLIPINLSVDVRTNCIVAAGSPGDLLTVEALIESLDREDKLAREMTVYPLRNMRATDVANTVNTYITTLLQIQNSAPGVISPWQQIESAVIVVADEESNSLLINATPRFYDEIMKVIQEIDKSPPQVVIQVLIAEITLSEADDWASEIGIQDPLMRRRGSGMLFNNPTNSPPSGDAIPGTVGTQLLSNLGAGRVGPTGYAGLAFAASSEYIQIQLRALYEKKRLEVLSSPQIMTLNNTQSAITIGQEIPRYGGTSVTGQTSQENIVDVPVVLMLQVKPTISPDDTIMMALRVQNQKVGSEMRVGDRVSSAIDTTNVVTMISAANNETVILGGLISKSEDKVRKKVPLLGDIPVMGKFFRVETDQIRRTELLILLTPRIVRSPDEMEKIKQVEMARMNWCRRDVAEVYGDIGTYSVNSERPYTGEVPIIRPGPVKIETLERIESQPYIAPQLPRRD